MLQSLWKSISSWGDLPANFPYTLGSAVPYSFELPGGFVQLSATSTKLAPNSAVDGASGQRPILDALLNPGSAAQVSVFALKRDKQQSPPSRGSGSVSQRAFDRARNHLAKCKTLLHPNLLKVLGTYETNNALYIVTECCFSLVHVAHLIQLQKQQQDLAAKRPSSLPHQQTSDPPSGVNGTLSDSTRKAEAAAAAAAELAGKSCWNLLELAEGLSFLNDQCRLAHGEVSPFSVFVTPHGKWKLSSFVLTRPLEEVSWPSFYTEVLSSASASQGWEPPRPSSGSRPDILDRWGLCSLFAWWQDIRRDPYNSARLLRRSGTGGNSCGVSLGINDTSFRKAVHGLEPPLQQLMQKILDSRGGATPLSKLIDGGDACFAGDACCQFLTFIRTFPVKTHVDKEAFFEQQLPAALHQQQISSGLALHLLLPELALLLMNSSASAYHCSILKCIMSMVTPLSTLGCLQTCKSSSSTDDDAALPLQLFSEVLAHAFDSSDRAIRFTLLSQLPAVQSLLPDSFFGRTWEPLIVGLEDSAPPIRAFTARILSLYVSRLPRDASQTSSVFVLLEQRLRDAAGGVRLEAACVYCAQFLPLAGLVTLLAVAPACFLSPSPAVVAAAPVCIHALTDAAKARAEEKQQLSAHLTQAEAEQPFRHDRDNCKSADGWLTTVKSLGVVLGFSKRGDDSTKGALHKNRDSGGPRQNSAGNVPTEAGSNPLRTSAHAPQAPEAPYSSAPPSRSTDEFKDAREPINSWGDDTDIPADIWETTPDFETPSFSRSSGGSDGTRGVVSRLESHAVVQKVQGSSTESRASRVHPGASVNPSNTGELFRSFPNLPNNSHRSKCSKAGMRLQGGAAPPELAGSEGTGATGSEAKRKPRNSATATKAGDAGDCFSADDFFASVEREAAQRGF
ncbi:SCY kinase (incomplete catalytic triad), putative [Eimeria tenella]|uniref:SCY kinase (Incomplete catalytic triad), putative n=1 Tax=Eimeria tenella TaxID=5802 RepID=U6L0A1_EIMTE|nr:SCY kinase (incomplete catalytic triad), putative [Eimeria tenella]CDJ42613.1 SCY kinase (incomplete catalytic triad), putative [Eimeria tenella]|eukprot:XP_013233363.1 SCY kinase (incomplete catalytic triad), putative [Eimeria tenella]